MTEDAAGRKLIVFYPGRAGAPAGDMTDVHIAVDRQWIDGKLLMPGTPVMRAKQLVQGGYGGLTFNLRGRARTP